MHLPCAGGGPSCNTTPPPRPEAGSAQGRASPGQWRGGRGGRSSLGESREPRFPLPRAWGGPWGGLQGGKPGSGSAGGHSRGAGSPSETASHMAHMHACTCVRTSVDILCRCACTCGHMPTRVHAPSLVHTRAHACPCILTHANTCACTQSRTRAHVHSCTHVFARTLMPTPAHSSTYGYNTLPPPNLHPPPAAVWVWVPPPSAPPCPPPSVPSAGVTCPHTALLCREYTGDTQHGVGGGQTDRRTGHKPAVPRPTGTPPPQSLAPAASLRAGDQPRTPALGGTGSPLQTPPAPSCEALPQTPVGMLWGSGGGGGGDPPSWCPGWQQAGLLSRGARGARQPRGSSQTGVTLRPRRASLADSPGGPGESRFALRSGGSHWPRHPRRPGGAGVSLGSPLSPGAGLPKAALGALEAREAFQAQGTPFTLGAGGSRGAWGSLGSRRTQAAHVALLSFASRGALDAHVALEAAGAWESRHTWGGRGGGELEVWGGSTPKRGES